MTDPVEQAKDAAEQVGATANTIGKDISAAVEANKAKPWFWPVVGVLGAVALFVIYRLVF